MLNTNHDLTVTLNSLPPDISFIATLLIRIVNEVGFFFFFAVFDGLNSTRKINQMNKKTDKSLSNVANV